MLKKFFFFFFTICYQQKLWLRLSLLQDNSAFFPNLSEEIIPQLFPIIPLFVSNSICGPTTCILCHQSRNPCIYY